MARSAGPGRRTKPRGPSVAAVDRMLAGLKPHSRRRVAVFLGAGASRSFGYPLTRDLMLQIFGGLLKNEIDILNKADRTQLLKFLTELLPGERYSEKKVPLVTGVLSLLDFSLSTGQALLPGWTMERTRRVRQSLERAIVEVIPDHEGFEGREEGRFNQFCSFLAALRPDDDQERLGIITTNYDMVSDMAALEVAEADGDDESWNIDDIAKTVDFGFRWVNPLNADGEEFYPRPVKPKVSLYKLHGSTNWLRCPLCENVYINPYGPIAWNGASGRTSSDNQCHCSKTRLVPQIVSPSFVREMREPNLAAVWKNALELLRDAGHWIIIGYSFPDEDVAVRALFTRAFGSNRPAPRISVIQYDDAARLNYESFFPAKALTYYTGGLDLVLERWKQRGKA